MPLIKLSFKPGVNKENTRYTTEGGWYTSEKVRFRQGTPEKIGGWVRISANTFRGLARSLWAWATNVPFKVTGVSTDYGQYAEYNGTYGQIDAVTSTFPAATFSFTAGSSVVVVNLGLSITPTNQNWIGAGAQVLKWTTTTGNITPDLMNNYHKIVAVGSPSYSYLSIDIGVNSSVTTTATADLRVLEAQSSVLHSQANFGQDLVFNRRGGNMCLWNGSYALFLPNNTFTTNFAVNPNSITIAVTAPGNINAYTNGRIPVKFYSTSSLPSPLVAGTTYYLSSSSGSSPTTLLDIYTALTGGSLVTLTNNGTGTHYIDLAGSKIIDVVNAAGNVTADAPTSVNVSFVSDIYRFAFAFGVNDYGSGDTFNLTAIDKMLIRWCDQEDISQWTPLATNQAGSLRLSRGSELIQAIQARQEILVWTDIALYSLQYQGPPTVWGAQLLGDNISIINQNAVGYAAGAAYWMGVDKFYIYNGNVDTLKCDLRQYIFSDINRNQTDQIFAGTNEGFNEVWWFYCSANSSVVDRYVIYNYSEKIWYHGSLGRTAWLDSGIRDYPLAATYSYNLVDQEKGIDNNETGTPAAINAYIESAETDVGDGDSLMFVKRVIPDLTFRDSTTGSPAGTLTLRPLLNSGSGYLSPASLGGTSANADATVTRTATVPIEAFTQQVYIRIRCRQLTMKFESNALGVQWQLGSMRLDVKRDGKNTGYGV